MPDTEPVDLDGPWLVVLKPAPGPGPPMAQRVRHFLKAAIRQYRLRIEIVRTPTAAELARPEPVGDDE